MTTEIHLILGKIHPASLIKRMLLGAIIGLAIISLFIFSPHKPNPEWGDFWRIKPLLITPLFGALGILGFYAADFVDSQWKKIAVSVVGSIAFLIALWLGVVLGLNGTMWN